MNNGPERLFPDLVEWAPGVRQIMPEPCRCGLFSKYDLGRELEKREQIMCKAIDEVNAARLLNTSTDDWCDHLEDKYRLEPVVLDEANVTVDGEEVKVDVSADPDG